MLDRLPEFFLQELPFLPEDPSVRAERCLRAHLSPSQLEEYMIRGRFRVRGSLGTIYTILSGRTNNVIRHCGGNMYIACCSVPDLPVPLADQLLIQKLYLETNEPGFLEKAASSGVVYSPTGV